jgi:hypothetical protein
VVGYESGFRVVAEYFFGVGGLVWGCFRGYFVVWWVFLVCFVVVLLLNGPWTATELLLGGVLLSVGGLGCVGVFGVVVDDVECVLCVVVGVE